MLLTLQDFIASLRMLIISTIVLGGLYPLGVYGIGKWIFPREASGSLIYEGKTVIGSELLAQKTTGRGLFYPRPSAGDFQTVPSAASNLGPTSLALNDAIQQRLKLYFDDETRNRLKFSDEGVGELLTASASGLDPDLSPEAVRFQMVRVIAERHLNDIQTERLSHLIDLSTVPSTFGLLGRPRINIGQLNRSLLSLESK